MNGQFYMKFKANLADITNLTVDAIVNSASYTLSGGGGVDGAIRRAAGPDLDGVCPSIAPCPVGEARATSGYRLAANLIIHTNAPINRPSDQGRHEKLAQCYGSAVALADRYWCREIAFPLIGAGARGFTVAESMNAARQSLTKAAGQCRYVEEVIFVTPDNRVKKEIDEILNSKFGPIPTMEEWGPDFSEIQVKSRRLWLYVVGMFHHLWAVVQRRGARDRILLMNDYGRVIDWLDAGDKAEAMLAANGFDVYCPELEEASFIAPPRHRPHRYSGAARQRIISGKMWQDMSGRQWMTLT